ncbi:hypothetical protein RRG37_04395 [Mycoplasmopsis felis]|uniref:hypothetical protein n=1 Tax=Mycoplasmopsis felis TaxID=33923 RepID=UPI002AFFBC02|nr:hypothetical protein [Mycoplasmopsis felis]WQQ06494.1 hypothetical protein RRG40_01515 [Mycoplasmopsis felis]
MKIKLKKTYKMIFFIYFIFSRLSEFLFIIRNNEPNRLVFKYLKQKYWHKVVIDIHEQLIQGKKDL